MFITDKRTKKSITLNAFEPNKVYLCLSDNCFYIIIRICSPACRIDKYLVNLNNMRGQKIEEVPVSMNEFIEVNYSFEIRD